MCSIIGSFSKDKFRELVRINQHRGNFSWSVASIVDNKMVSLAQNFGELPDWIVEDIEPGYYLGHVQAPTGGMIKDISRVHPAEVGINMLWHNGIIVPRGVRFIQNLVKSDETFDTLLLNKAISQEGFRILSEIEGLFACVMYYNKNFYIFRTKHGKLFIDSEMNISSERFEGSKCINYDTVYKIDFNNKSLEPIETFKTLKFNIVVPGEL